MPAHYGNPVGASDHEEAVRTVLFALENGIRFLDTSNGYGDGGSERIVGEALRRFGGLPDDVLLATKADPDPETGDFGGARVRASLEESLERLGVDRIRVLYLHDPERIGFDRSMAEGGPVDALLALRDAGSVDHLGIAGGPVPLLRQFIDTGLFDVLLSHNRYSLLDRSAAGLFATAASQGIGVVNAAPFGGGMLAKGPSQRGEYAYGQGAPGLASAAARMAAICDGYGVGLASVALQFSMRNPDVHSTAIGASRASRVAAALAEAEIPDAIWDDLEEATPEPSSWLG